MSDELEIAAMASAGALKGAPPDARERPDGACDNCGTAFSGKFCPECGQLAADFHRPILSMLGNVLGDTFALDGRLARTIPALLFRPGKVTRAYLEGRRARYVPPFRLFLVSSLLFFTTLFMIGDQQNWLGELDLRAASDGDLNVSFAASDTDGIEISNWLREDGTIDREAMRAEISSEAEFETEADRQVALAAAERFANVYEQQGRFINIIKDWAPRLSLVMFPVFALFLTILYAWRRRVFIYDHLVVSLHYQSFFYIAGTLLMLAGLVIGGWAGFAMLVAMLAYLYRLLRQTYGTGRILAVLRTVLLFVASIVAISLLAIGLVVIGFLQV